MPDFVPPESDVIKPVESGGFTPPESDVVKSGGPVAMPKQGSAFERMMGSMKESSKGLEQAALGITAQDQAISDERKKQWAQAKTPEERMSLVKEWALDHKDRIMEMGIKGALPVVGERMAGLPGRVVGGVAGEALGSAVAGQPITAGSLTAAGIRVLPGAQSQQAMMNALRWTGAGMLADQAQSVIDKGKLADVQTMANTAKNATMAALATSTVDTGARAKSEAIRQGKDLSMVETLTDAHKANLVLDPTIYNKGVISGGLTSVAGQSNLQKAASAINAPRVDELIRQQAGLAEGAPVSRTNMEFLRTEAAAPYRVLSSISKAAEKEVDNWKNLQAEATDAAVAVRNARNRAERIQLRQEAQQAQADADASFSRLERHAQRAGLPDLPDKLQEARTHIAELHAIEKGFPMSVARNFDALTLGEMYSAGVPLRGNMLTIGRLAEAMPQVLGDPTKATGLGAATRLGTKAGIVAAGMAGGGPVGAAAAAAAAYGAPKIAQGIVLNPFVQGATAIPQYGTTQVTAPANILQFGMR